MLYRAPLQINTILSEYPNRNSGAAGAAIIRNFEDEDLAALLIKIDFQRLNTYYSDVVWDNAVLVLKCPARTYSKIKPIITVAPTLVEFEIGRGAWLASEKVTNNIENSVSGVSNWEYRDDSVAWDAPGAVGVNDIDISESITYELNQPYWDEVAIPLSSQILSGLLDGTYTGVRVSLEPNTSDNEIWFGTLESRSRGLRPFLELRSENQFLSNNSSFDIDNINTLSLENINNGISTMPTYKGQPYNSYNVRCNLNLVLSHLREKSTILLDQSAAIFDSVSSGRISATIDPSSLINIDDRIVDIFNVSVGEQRIGDDTARDGLQSGSRYYTLELNAEWQIEDNGSWVTVNNTLIDVKYPTVVGTNLAYVDNFVYPRITTIGARRDFRVDEGPLFIRVHVDDRPPMEIANLQLRRRLNSRRSALIEDLAWGVVSGRQRHPGDWIIKPCAATKLDHDGSTHIFKFDPSILESGLYKFEFVNLNNGNVIRQSNSIDFQIF